jgi:hypothetical protein
MILHSKYLSIFLNSVQATSFSRRSTVSSRTRPHHVYFCEAILVRANGACSLVSSNCCVAARRSWSVNQAPPLCPAIAAAFTNPPFSVVQTDLQMVHFADRFAWSSPLFFHVIIVATPGSPSSLTRQSRDSSERLGGAAGSLFLRRITWLIYDRCGLLWSGGKSQRECCRRADEMGLIQSVRFG